MIEESAAGPGGGRGKVVLAVDGSLFAITGRLAAPLLGLITGLGVISAALLVAGGVPSALAARPALYWAAVAGVVLLGTAVPAAVALVARRRRRPDVVTVVAALCPMVADAVALGSGARTAGLPLLLGVLISIGLATATLVAIADGPGGRARRWPG